MGTDQQQEQHEPGNDRVAIVGAGPSGSLLAVALAQRGVQVDLYERRADPRSDNLREGRSINLGLSKRGMCALEMIGILDRVLNLTVEMRGRMIHPPGGECQFQPYGARNSEVLHSIDRNELNRLLLDTAEQCGSVKMNFLHRLHRVDKRARTLHFESPEGEKSAAPAWTVGADGAFSTMRRELQRGERADYHQEFLEWGYKELGLPAGSNGASLIELTALHLWPRESGLIVSHPNRNGSHTLTLFLPFEGPISFASMEKPDEFHRWFSLEFPDIAPLLPDLRDQWTGRYPGSLVTTRTRPWAFEGWATLVGDACHAVYPFYGQGMNSAFEDCTTLIRALDEHGQDLKAAFISYEEQRRADTDVLGELSKSNFIELKQRVRSPLFLARKRLDLTIHRIWPGWWIPLYTMIAHTTMPYAMAQDRAKRQERIMTWGAIFLLATCTVLFTALIRHVAER